MKKDNLMNPLWHKNINHLYKGDCLDREILNEIPDNSIDIVFTSPPYNLGNSNYFGKWYNSKTTNPGAKYKKDPSLDSKENYVEWIVGFVRTYLEKAKYVFLNLQSSASNKKDINEIVYKLNDVYCDKIVWNKSHGVPHGKNSRVMTLTFEDIFIFSKENTRRVGTKEWYGNVKNVIDLNGNRYNKYGKIHAAMFPVELPKYIFDTFVKDDGVVCDPFMGLGSSGIAAILSGKRFIGIEIDDEYYEIALERIREEGFKE